MTAADTSREAVERLAALVAPLGSQSGKTRWAAANCLCALLARAEKAEAALADAERMAEARLLVHRQGTHAECVHCGGKNMILEADIAAEVQRRVDADIALRVAAAVRAEREACAKHLENWPVEDERMVADECAAAIRARGERQR